MAGGHNHCEILIEDLRVPAANMLGGRGQGHLLGQYRLGPARLAHCMRWIGQAETALDMMVARSLERYSHGSILAEKQGIQWLIADSAVELYQCKLMVLHAAYQIEQGMEFTAVVSMAKHFVANSLWRIIDRAIQVHGALGYSTDTPLAHMLQQARWARFADGADEIHQMRIAQRTIAAYTDHGTTKIATGNLPLIDQRSRELVLLDPGGSIGASEKVIARSAPVGVGAHDRGGGIVVGPDRADRDRTAGGEGVGRRSAPGVRLVVGDVVGEQRVGTDVVPVVDERHQPLGRRSRCARQSAIARSGTKPCWSTMSRIRAVNSVIGA